jgi:hypothetical protein
MIKVLVGDLFTSKAQTLVNTVNCVGIMGKGIALEFKKRFPDMFKDYEERCKRKEVSLGALSLSHTDPHVLNFPQDHWRPVTNLADLERGLSICWRITRNGELLHCRAAAWLCEGQPEWRVVGPLYRHLRRMDIPAELYAHMVHRMRIAGPFLESRERL